MISNDNLYLVYSGLRGDCWPWERYLVKGLADLQWKPLDICDAVVNISKGVRLVQKKTPIPVCSSKLLAVGWGQSYVYV